MTQWIPPKRQKKVNKKYIVKRMTEGTPDSCHQNENIEDSNEIPDESESDAGSDIFMPGGITMKATELPSDNEAKEDASDHNDVDKNTINKNICNNESDNAVVEENKPKVDSPIDVDHEKSEELNQTPNLEDDKMSDSGSSSSCLEINMEDDSAFPCSNKEKNINSVNEKNNVLEERNIFTNISNILDSGEQSDDEKEEKANEKDGVDKSGTDKEDGNEPHMSEDFMIGLRQKSYDVDPFCPDAPSEFEVIEGNLYLIDKKKSRSKEDRYMQCECPFEPDDPVFVGCDDDCLNRLLLIECSPRNCPTGEFCTNRHFQRGCVFDLEIFKAGKKGWGLKTKEDIPKGSFVMEYCGEVVNYDAFQDRTQEYHNEGISHFYFMTLKQNEIIDATKKGSKSRFINHSCDPNCETQKWTVNGFLRVGFFAVKDIEAGDELSFDYQFQRYGEKPQDCFCGADICRGVIGSEQVSTAPSALANFMSASSPSHPEKKKKKGKLLSNELAEELHELFSRRVWELTEPRQTLELLRLMVKVSTTAERIVLLKIIQVSKNNGAMKAFVRYKGLSLLWSWMVDAPESKLKYKIEILKTLKHVPVPNRNELDDSKVEGIVQKWSATPVVDVVKIAATKTERRDSLDDNNTPPGSDIEGKNDDGGTSSQDESSKEDNDDNVDEKLDKTAESVEEGEILEDTDGEFKTRKKKKEEKSNEKLVRRQKKVVALSAALMDEWRLLKEVFRIPKKSQTPDRRPRPDTETSSPRHHDDKKNTPLSKISSSNTSFSSPPSTTRHAEINNKPSSTIPNHYEDSTGHSTTDDPVSTTDDVNSSPVRDYRPGKKREWKKSPDSRSGDSRYSRDQYEGEDGRKYDDLRNDRRESRWGRDRRSSYDRDRRSNWNKDNDDNNSGGRGGNQSRWGRNRHWNDRNNRGNRRYGDRDNSMNRNNEQRNNNENNWNGGGNSHWNGPHQQSQPGLLPHKFRGITPMVGVDPQHPPPRPPGIFPAMMGQPPPPNMIGQPHINMMTQGPLPPGMVPPQPMQAINPLNVLPNSVNQNSPLISPMSNQPFNSMSSSLTPSTVNQSQPPFPPAPSSAGQFNTATGNTPDVTTLNMVNQLLLLNAERLKQTQNSGSHSSTPDNNRNPSAPASPHRTPSVSSPTQSKHTSSLPPHWKTATDADGRVYYYHTQTRETSWNPPVAQPSSNDDGPPKRPKKNSRGSTDSNHSPVRHSPRIAAADTTHKSGPRTPPLTSSSRSTASSSQNDLQKILDTFKSKISSVVVNCLNGYRKVDCKQGRIKNVDDFKFLARKLTHGLIMKERQRVGNEELLSCNDSVKLKVKEYIRNYMKKFGVVYIRS